MFIGREVELKQLNSSWKMPGADLIVIYGKRRVGKTELIKEFLNTTQGIYYLADKRSHKDQLLEFARVTGDYFNDHFITEKGFSSWFEAFDYIKVHLGDNKMVIAIDEYPYLSEVDAATSSIFQKIWDEYLKSTNITLILCGSSMSMMESELLSYKAPLYGRLTGKILLKPMSYKTSQLFFPKSNFNEFVKYFAITGGMPAYMQSFTKYNNVKDAISVLCFNSQGLYNDEVNIALRQELRAPNNYFAILKAISSGNTRVSKVANHAGLSAQLVNKYLDTLERLQFVKREIPITEAKPHKSKKGIYIITENYVRFWFEYIYAFSSDIEIGNFKNASNRYDKYRNILESIAYEQIAREDLHYKKDYLFQFERLGRYWNRDIEIDGVAFNEETREIAFMEAKWTRKLVDIRVLNKLRQKASIVDIFPDNKKDFYVLYSKSGFTKELIELARSNQRILLVKGIDRVTPG